MYEAYKPFRDVSCTVCLKIDSTTPTPSTMMPTIEPTQTVLPPSDDGKLSVCILYGLF